MFNKRQPSYFGRTTKPYVNRYLGAQWGYRPPRSALGGGNFLSGLLGTIGKVAKQVLPAVAPILLNAGINKIGQVANNPNSKFQGAAQKLSKVGNVIDKNKELVGSLGGLASSIAAQQLSDAGHDNAADLIGNTSQSLLQGIVNRGKSVRGLGIRGVGKQQGRNMQDRFSGFEHLFRGTGANDVIPSRI